ncbi:MAG: hypothetical protein KatS3mg015_0803 [Fimbriimonadales bacterium]|nr:MAG: hypothetical protein KatS3mg015_0803 [Fimbriimonadales bacterium]
MRRWTWMIVTGAAFLAVGCAKYEPNRPQPIGDLTADLFAEYEKSRVEPPLAGNPTPLNPNALTEAVNAATFSSRRNPFAMFSEEMAFETGIRYRLILSKMPGYAREFSPPEPEQPESLRPIEPQPYRRLAGIYMGDTVQAIVEVEGENQTYIVSPGDRVGNTEWFVESIDGEKMVLRRSSNRRPDRVIVWLESPPYRPGSGGGGVAGGGTQPSPGGGTQQPGGRRGPGVGGGASGGSGGGPGTLGEPGVGGGRGGRGG